MQRDKYTSGQSERYRSPRVNDIWCHKKSNISKSILLVSEWETGFRCVGVNDSSTLNFNQRDGLFLDNHKFLREATADEVKLILMRHGETLKNPYESN